MSVMYLLAHTKHEAMFQLSQHTHMLTRPHGLSLSWLEHMPKLSSSRQDVAHVHHITPTFSHDPWVVVDKQLPCTRNPASPYWYFTLVCHAGCRWECLNWRRLKDTVVFFPKWVEQGEVFNEPSVVRSPWFRGSSGLVEVSCLKICARSRKEHSLTAGTFPALLEMLDFQVTDLMYVAQLPNGLSV